MRELGLRFKSTFALCPLAFVARDLPHPVETHTKKKKKRKEKERERKEEKRVNSKETYENN